MSNDTLGIDFGTSTTLAAMANDKEVVVLRDTKGAVVPSFVAFPPNGGVLVGDAAKYRRPIDPTNTLFSFKRIIGQPFGSEVVRQYVAKYPFDVCDRDGQPRFRTRAGDLAPTEVAAKLIGHMLELGRAVGAQPTRVVVGVPVEFGSAQREAVLEAVRLAGGEDAVCVEEPLAIARACLRDDLQRPRRIAVYDVGGGTFNLAICDVRAGTCSLLAVGGDDYLGGDDVDQACATWVNQQVLQQLGWDVRTNAQTAARLLAECERVKISLSTMVIGRVKLGAIEANDALQGREITVERGLIDKLSSDLVRRTFVICDEVIARAGLTVPAIDEVFLGGGTTRIPAIQAAVSAYFGKRPRLVESPDHLVAIGAAIIAAERRAAPTSPARPPTPWSERRQAVRHKLSLPVRMRRESELEGKLYHASDVSKGGMFVATEAPPALDSRVVVALELTPCSGMEIAARVVYRISPEEAAQRPECHPGVGLEFVGLEADKKQRLEQLLVEAQRYFMAAAP